MLFRAMGVAPLRKANAVFCIVGSRIHARDNFKVCGGSVVGYAVVCLLQTRSAYLRGMVDEKSSVVVEPRGRRGERRNLTGEQGGRGREVRNDGNHMRIRPGNRLAPRTRKQIHTYHA